MNTFGSNYNVNGELSFRVWVSKSSSVNLVLIENDQRVRYSMHPQGNGIFEFTLKNPPKIVDYFYEIEKDQLRPDPYSRWQPMGVHGHSRAFQTNAFTWSDANWKGILLTEYIIYELHIGTFSPEGTFEGAIQKLDYLKELGITAIEIMPMIQFPGKRNWGYDGTNPFAPHHDYGGPEGLKNLINACHEKGLAVILDVVYNHLGPEGNYLGQFSEYFTDHYKTPWGQAVNYEHPFVRKYFIDNALYWLEEYHVDALRLDAIHAIFDSTPRHILEEMQEEFQKKAKQLNRHAFIFIESDLNDVRYLQPKEEGGFGIDAQWSDDFHHAVHAFLTKSAWEYFQDFGSMRDIAKAITKGFVYDGIWSKFRKKIFGTSSEKISGEHFVVCLQNHDQVGNAGLGKRLGSLLSEKQYGLASTLLFSTPNLPLLFMGQEWNASTEFLYFTSFEDPELAKNVTEGYKKEFNIENDFHDPQSIEVFERSKLQWKELEEQKHQSIFCLYQELIALRKKIPFLSNHDKELVNVTADENHNWFIIKRESKEGGKGFIACNFSDADQMIPILFSAGQWNLLFSSAGSQEFSPIKLDQEETRPISIPAWSAFIFSHSKIL